MDIRKLQRAIVDGLEDVKAHDIVVFNTEHLSPLFERVIIASGTSNRQTKALASSVRDKVKGHGFSVLSTEGADNGEWIIVDCGPAVAHILQPAIRQYYHLEEIWGGKPVHVKLAEAPRGLVKASNDDEHEDEPAPVAKAPAARKSAGTGAKKAAGTTARRSAPAKKAAAQAPARRDGAKAPARAAGRGDGRTAAKSGARPAVKTASRAAGKTSAGKTSAGKTTAGKTAGKTPATARKTPRR